MATQFTMGEAAAMAVTLQKIAVAGCCDLPVGAIAARAGVCATTVRNALRQARVLGLLAVEERRVSYDRSLPNVVTVMSRELALWLRTRARAERQGGGCKTALPTTNHLFPLPSSTPPAARDRASRWEPRPTRDDRSKRPPLSPAQAVEANPSWRRAIPGFRS